MGMLLSFLATGSSLADDHAAGRTLRPTAVAIHIHEEIADQRFVPKLVARLQGSLAPPIVTIPTKMDLEPFRPTFGLMDARPLLDALIGSIDWRRDGTVVRFVVIADDMQMKPARFNFAASAGDTSTPFHLSIVSLARLQQLTDRTAQRVFKLIAKNTARLMGYASSDACLFAFPRSISELDATPENFCEPDLAALVAAGIARSPQ
ncbi:hypothetical protein [Aromatoleum anaerobium]|uniref:Uncharacterized protein n=1 Tax=Aromatoleum anaerobium TaxID=182180 RepID=A0ABX1PP62_9RHOO|nr:hypothetical protein [Aromatoleum anaerobium]MCK0505304.1 hypothetical protein [Aromatoleum anaerobium]